MNSQAFHRQFSVLLTVCTACWVVFIFYGSLLPFAFKPMPSGYFWQQYLGLSRHVQDNRSITDWLTNIGIFIPVAFMGLGAMQSHMRWGKLTSIVAIVLCCVALSLCIEWFQLFFPPRNSSIVDVIANSIGSVLGVWAWFLAGKHLFNLCAKVCLLQQSAAASWSSVPKATMYSMLAGSILIIFAWSGFFSEVWLAPAAIAAKWQNIQFMPFLAHQAADIFRAVLSIVIAASVFAVFGISLWMSNFCQQYPVRIKLGAAAGMTAVIAGSIELSKVFLASKSTETGNIVVAAIAGSVGYFFASCLSAYLQTHRTFDVQHATNLTKVQDGQIEVVTFGFIIERIVANLCGLSVIALVVMYPIGQIQLVVCLIVYGFILLRYPAAWLVVIPALLPVLDLTPWTGRQLLNEYDAFVLTTFVIGFWRYAGQPMKVRAGRFFWYLLIAFLLSYVVSTIIGVLPLQPLDANAFASPYSYYSALLIVKGALFAVGLFVLLSHLSAVGHPVYRNLSFGMALGLLFAAASVFWERLAYASLTDFTDTFRSVGLFSTMNTGGPHLDAFLISAIPFVLILATQSKNTWLKLTYISILVLGVYAVMMTFSRAAFAALVVILVMITCWQLLSVTRQKVKQHGAVISTFINVGIVCAVITPVVLGSFMQSRLTETASDFSTRFNNWHEATSIMTNTWSVKMFGMGLGRYPESYQWLASTNNKPAIHGFVQETDNTFLRLGKGATLYVEQIVSPKPESEYQISLQARALSAPATLNLLLCDRTYLDGFECQSSTIKINEHNGQWQSFAVVINSENVGKNKLRLSKLSLENAGSSGPVEIDNLSMRNTKGIDLVTNGDFQAGADHWYFSSPNNYSPWRVENLFLHIFFEQGWIGLVLFGLLIAALMGRLLVLALDGSGFAVATLGAVVGYVVVGTFDSMFDSPRLVMVFGLLVAVSGIFHGQPLEAIEPVKTIAPPRDDEHFQFSSVKPQIRSAISVEAQTTWTNIAAAVFTKLLLLSLAIWAFIRLPFIPYNIRELLNPNHPVIAPIIFAALLIWVFGLPAAIGRWSLSSHRRGVFFIILILIHGGIAWLFLQFAVMPESIHDIIGSPVWSWPGQTEYIFRFIPFMSVFSLNFLGGALFFYSQKGRNAAARLWWIMTALVLLPIQYWIIIRLAATDNLTELIANNASVGASLLLSVHLFLVGYLGTALATYRLKMGVLKGMKIVTLIIMSIPVSYLFVSYGTSSTIYKEKQIFSALQFLLSPDREHYLSGWGLWVNFAVAHCILIGLIAISHINYDFKLKESR